MSNKLNRASAVAVAAMVVTIAVSADGSGAAAQATMAAAINQEPVTQMVSQPVVQPLPAEASATDQLQNTVAIEQPKAQSLGQLVAAQPQPGELSRELNCLAGAIYFEAKSESLEGQLAVGRVVVERSKSGRFPNSYCGVVFQRYSVFPHMTALQNVRAGLEFRQAPFLGRLFGAAKREADERAMTMLKSRSEEHTSELQSQR